VWTGLTACATVSDQSETSWWAADIEDLDELLRVLASPHRRAILQQVWSRERGAGELAQHLGLAPASVSEHLKVLRKSGLVVMRVEGTYRLYRARPERLRDLSHLLAQAFPDPGHTASSEGRDD
jgi:DNA-binding transcriptional ArsR family regulator